jgi:hypothetical protein
MHLLLVEGLITVVYKVLDVVYIKAESLRTTWTASNYVATSLFQVSSLVAHYSLVLIAAFTR